MPRLSTCVAGNTTVVTSRRILGLVDILVFVLWLLLLLLLSLIVVFSVVLYY